MGPNRGSTSQPARQELMAQRSLRTKSPSQAPPRARAKSDRSSPSDAATVERLRKICLALPDANERISHGEPTWFAGKGKSFAMVDNHHHGSAHLSVWLPQPPDIQESLIDSDSARFFRPPYVGPRGWVGVVLDTKPEWDMVEQLVREAY